MYDLDSKTMAQSQSNSLKFFAFKKKPTNDLKQIFGTHLRIVQTVDHIDANRSLDQWNLIESENQTTHQWDSVDSNTPYCSRYQMLFSGNTWVHKHCEIKDAVFRAANDWNLCVEFPLTIEFILTNGKTCGYTVYFGEARIGEYRERMEKFKNDEKKRQIVEDMKIECKMSLDDSILQVKTDSNDRLTIMRRIAEIRLAKKRRLFQA